MSLFEGLNIATRGLSAAQLGINVTGQNVVNASDPNYSRKRIEQQAASKRDGSYGQMGFGVEVYSINRVRDQFIDRLVNEESTRYGYYEMKSKAYTRIEDIFGERRDHKALNDILNAFWDSWADLANDPEKQGAREALRSNTQSLTGQFNYLATQLRTYKDTINDEIEARVERINQITSSIYRCNMVITSSENTIGNKANDTRDQRDALLQELASLVDVDYFEDDQGVLNVSSNGSMLVSPARAHELVVKRTNMTQQDGYSYSKVEITLSTTNREFAPRSGELKALMEVRDVDIPEYESYINELAQTLITEVNKIHQGGYGLAANGNVGLTFIDFFDADPAKFNAANMSIGPAIKENLNNIAAGLGGNLVDVHRLQLEPAVDTSRSYNPDEPFRSVPIALHQLDPALFPDASQYRYIQKGSLTIDVIIDPETSPPVDPPVHTRRLVEGQDFIVDYENATITFLDNATSSILGYSYYDYNSTPPLAVVPPVQVSNPMTMELNFKYHENGYKGPGDNQNAILLSQLRDKSTMQDDVFGKNTQTINQFYSGSLARLGTEKNRADAGLDTRTHALSELKTHQNEVMGVDLDEEMASLIKYQHSYTASARYLTTINTMLDTLLNM
ncbi:MAG: flagellar hook-associated protein FlgK [Fibromonadaceae bacterium]|nr:flagellar hook-associated protein FlgK [Fibromonadaceae bacterium]